MTMLIALSLLAAWVQPSTRARADTNSYSGTISGKAACKYSITIDTDAKTFQGSLDCSKPHAGASLEGTYDGTSVTLGTVTPQVDGNDLLALDLDQTFTLPEGVDQAQAFANDLASHAGDLVQNLVPGLLDVLQGKLQDSSLLADDALKGFGRLVNAWDDGCSQGDEPPRPPLPNPPPDTCFWQSHPHPGNLGSQEAACPPLPPQHDVFIICVPTFLMGKADFGKKNVIFVGGGVLLALPIGASLDSLSTPEIDTTGSVIMEGGGIFGDNIRIKAGKGFDVAAGMVTMLGNVTIEGKEVGIGKTDLTALVPSVGDLKIPSPPGKTGEALDKIADSLNVPGEVFASTIVISATDVAVTKDSLVSTDGMGGAGAAFTAPSGTADGGADGDWGGSYGGLGNGEHAPVFMPHTIIGEPPPAGQPGPAFGNPVDPRDPGHGGGGSSGDAAGLPAGGLIRIAASGTLQIDGTVSATGIDSGPAFGEGVNGEHGGGGSGGGISLRAGTLIGTGTIAANGGGYRDGDANGFGGGGGGGRIALRYTDMAGFSGKIEAYGGRDQTQHGYTGGATRFTGGAGTVFLLKKGEKDSAGTLVVAGDGTEDWPPEGYTPIQAAWATPDRTLVVSDGATATAESSQLLRFKAIKVLRGGILTTPPGQHTLSLQADTVQVDATSRIDMTARGALGAHGGHTHAAEPALSDGQGESPGGRGAGDSFGGSHAGEGGTRLGSYPLGVDGQIKGHQAIGATYDDPINPNQYGGGGGSDNDTGRGTAGGGVLNLTAKTLQVDGRVMANGEAASAPNADDPADGFQVEGAGAGGTVNLHVGTLLGTGQIEADGGDSCLTAKDLLPGGQACDGETGGETGAGGGGGDVAIRYTSASTWSGTAHAYGGVSLEHAYTTPAGSWLPIGQGGAGTVFWLKSSEPATGGLLIVDDGRGGIRARGATAIPASAGTDQRTLIVRNGGLAAGSELRFGEVDVVDDGILRALPGTHRLSVTTGILQVDATSRIDVSGQGYRGGLYGADGGKGETGGAQPSVNTSGGSHGGKGGVGSGDSAVGSIYDSKTNPSRPGGGGGSSGAPGGGVLFITATTARIEGRLLANGLTSNGPTRDDPYKHDFGSSAGAGGTINATFGTLTGSGSMAANGGDADLTVANLLDPSGVSNGSGQAGAGGGGRIALRYKSKAGWHGTIHATGGINQSDNLAVRRGGAGTVYIQQVR